ncbi:MAG: flagellin [Phycisphaeraceae bacterium]
MSRINNNVSSLIAQRIVTQQQKGLTTTLERLSTGLRINRGADDPAGLIASEKLRAEKARISGALSNAERADQFANIAEGGLQEISSLLTEVQSLVSQTASESGLSTEEKEANQQQIDAILASIDQIANTTSFQGVKLLNGNFDFQVTGVAGTVDSYRVNGAKIADGSTLGVKAIVTTSAQHAGVFISAGAAALDLTDSTSRFTFEVAGAKGSREFSFASGTTLTDVATSINSFKSVTGLSAKVSGTGIVLKSDGFGSSEFASVSITSVGGQAGAVHTLSTTNENRASTAGATAFAAVTAPIRDEGQDVGAIVNGISARGKGKTLLVSTDALDVSITLTTAGAQAAATISALTINDGGAKFNIGPSVDVGNQVRLGLGNVAARHLGIKATGFIDELGSGKSFNLIDGNLDDANKIIGGAIDQVASLRGRIGAFQKFTIGSAINSLSVALENTSSAESVIRDTDFAAETANLTRSQILVNAANSVLSIANSAPQSVLSLL